MKNIPYLILFIAALSIASCKKEKVDPTDNTGNTNSGLESLISPGAENYCALVISDSHGNLDTVVWQNTAGDTTWGSRSSFGSGSGGNYTYYYSAGQVIAPKISGQFEKFQISFRKVVPAMQTFPCNFIDSVIKKGLVPITSDYLLLSLTDNYGLGMTTLNTVDDVFEVLKVTKLSTTHNGCSEVRVKIKLTNVQFGPFGCIVPPYKICEGLVQMDY